MPIKQRHNVARRANPTIIGNKMNTDKTISTSLKSIENKLDSMATAIAARHPVDDTLTKRLSSADTSFAIAVATIRTLQENFTGQQDSLDANIIYFALEGVCSQIKTAYDILAADTIYIGNLTDM